MQKEVLGRINSKWKNRYHAQDSINIRTETDPNIKADRDINIEPRKRH